RARRFASHRFPHRRRLRFDHPAWLHHRAATPASGRLASLRLPSPHPPEAATQRSVAEGSDHTGTPGDGAPSVARTRRAHRDDRVALLVLLAVPMVWFVAPALAGHPLVPGDDYFQNFPLRVLAGDLLGQGRLPLWNASIWSGTALLGGFNAGALYPGTFLFAVLHPVPAWVANEVAVYATCAAGMYLLLRRHRLVPLAAAIGAATFTFAGYMPDQVRHLSLVQGMSWVPWILLALEHVASRSPHRVAWWSLLAIAGGLVLLAGEPRARSNVVIIVAVDPVVLLWRPARRREVLLLAGLAAVAAFALGAVQLLPGLKFLNTSQRERIGFDFFTASSLRLQLLFVQ